MRRSCRSSGIGFSALISSSPELDRRLGSRAVSSLRQVSYSQNANGLVGTCKDAVDIGRRGFRREVGPLFLRRSAALGDSLRFDGSLDGESVAFGDFSTSDGPLPHGVVSVAEPVMSLKEFVWNLL